MTEKYDDLARLIIKHVGGPSNIRGMTHCLTRLRLKLKKESKADTDFLMQTDGIVSIIQSGGQYQIVIGNHVPDVFMAVNRVSGFQWHDIDEEKEKTNPLNWLIDIISGVFSPLLGVLGATGMIKGLSALLVATHIITETSGTYHILQAAGDGFFYFLPIILGYMAAKKFKSNEFIGVAIGASMLYPDLAALSQNTPLFTLFEGVPIIESQIHLTFLGIPVILANYASSIIPVIFGVAAASRVERLLQKVIPSVLKLFLVPFFTLLTTIPLTLLVIGPVATWVANLIGVGIDALYDISAVVAGTLTGGVWQILVIFGLHWGLVPIAVSNISAFGYDSLLNPMVPASFAQTGVVAAIYLKTKNQKLKSLSIPAIVSGICGVTEPAIYGITLPKRKPFVISCIAAAIGGGIVGLLGIKSYAMGGLGVFSFTNHLNPKDGTATGMIYMFFTCLFTFFIGFIICMFVYKEPKETVQTAPSVPVKIPEQNANKIKKLLIKSPVKGTMLPLSQVDSAIFAEQILGPGIAIEPEEDVIRAPVAGKITTYFHTGHAFSILTDDGTEILIHVGIDTVRLDGSGFTPQAAQGDQVEAGQILLTLDRELIRKEGYSLVTPIIVTKKPLYTDLLLTEQKTVEAGETLVTLI